MSKTIRKRDKRSIEDTPRRQYKKSTRLKGKRELREVVYS